MIRTPDWQSEDGRHRMWCGDCLELLPEMEAGSVDAVVTSPPYDSLRGYGGTFKFDFESIKTSLRDVCRHGGVVVWIVNDQTINGSESGSSFRQALGFIECGMNLHDTMIWDKGVCRYPETNRYYPTFEYMFVFSKGKPRVANLIADRINKCAGSRVARKSTTRTFDGKLIENSAWRRDKERKIKAVGVRMNIWRVPVASATDEKTGHPAMFPISLASDHIKTWSDRDDFILDPFTGSGTTGVACVKTGRRFMGIELHRPYFDIAVKRMEAAIREQSSEYKNN